MGQKVHPLGFRLGITQKHQSYWCTNRELSSVWIQDANFLRNFITKNYSKAGITRIEIRRRRFGSSSLTIEIFAARPNLFGNRETQNLDKLRDSLTSELERFYRKRNLEQPAKLQISLYVKPLANPDIYAHVLADRLVEDLEQRKPYRRSMKQLVQRARKAGVKGIKVQVSGRLNGADIARAEDVRDGAVPLQTLRANIDYCSKSAKTIYGLLGIKIWVFNGEQLSKLDNLATEL